MAQWTEADENELRRLLAAGRTLEQAGRALGRDKTAIDGKIRRMRRHEADAAVAPGSSLGETLEKSETGDGAVITSRSKTIRTLADALDAAQVDLAVWEVERHVVNKWDSASTVDKRPHVVELWQVKVWLRRRVSKVLADASAPLMARMGKHAPDYSKAPTRRKPADPHLLEVSIWDHHFGKLAWAKETGENYDLKIAERIYRHAGEELLAKASGFPIERIVLPIGQDFFHVDSWQNTTTAGTPQDVDGRLSKIFTVGQMAIVHLVDLLLSVAPVHILWVPGNHDYYTSWYLVKTLEAWYRTARHVTVDSGEMPRKHVEYGCNLIGYTHGNEEKHASLPAILAGQWPQAWARTTCREWHIGHWHKVRETHYAAADTVDGVLLRVLPSMAGTDGWHFRKGYTGGMRAAQAFVYSKTHGYAAHLNANAKEAA